jgi:pimeloyl-ACP methyl ester carboxylesterase
LPGADGLRVVAGAGHAAPLEQPDDTSALIAAFIRQT